MGNLLSGTVKWFSLSYKRMQDNVITPASKTAVPEVISATAFLLTFFFEVLETSEVFSAFFVFKMIPLKKFCPHKICLLIIQADKNKINKYPHEFQKD